jgi:hypothetical protein
MAILYAPAIGFSLVISCEGQVRVLCEECPALLDDLFDGLLWTAKSASTTEAGSIRVNYYVRHQPRPRLAARCSTQTLQL